MIFFKTYSILIVAIFILSFRKLNATLTPPKSVQEADERQKNCIDQISIHFKDDDDLVEHGKVAIDYFQEVEVDGNPDWSYCTIYKDNKYSSDHGDIAAYYLSFKNHLLSGLVPDLESFCNRYKEKIKNPELCVTDLKEYFPLNSHEALLKVFYSERKVNLPSIQAKKIIGPDYIDLALAYYEIIKTTYGVNIEADGMSAPGRFCIDRHRMR